LREKDLVNYWGYNTLNYFSVDPRYCSKPDPQSHVTEFKTVVKTLHSKGIQVILDISFGHSAEGDISEPLLSYKGIDASTYYHIKPSSQMENVWNVNHPFVEQWLMDILRYWAKDMRVDGFRLDIISLWKKVSTLEKLQHFLSTIRQDPILREKIFICEENW
jgi:isoamylase